MISFNFYRHADNDAAPLHKRDMRLLVEQANRLAQSGQFEQAGIAFREVLRRDPHCVDAHAFFGACALRAQRYAEAAAAFEKCCARMPSSAGFQFNLGMARENCGDLAGAIEAYLRACRLDPKDARFALFAGAALEAAGRSQDAVTMFSLADEAAPALRKAKDRADAPPEIRARSATSDRLIKVHFTSLHDHAVDEAESELVKQGEMPDLSRVRRAVWTQTHVGPIEYRAPAQAPSIFYMPDLEVRAVTPSEMLPWAEKIEAATGAIRAEFLAAVGVGTPMSPYVQENVRDPTWRELRGKLDWSSLHLFNGAEETPFSKLFPRTLAALEAVDIVRVRDGRPVQLLFSKLKPGAHIPPHHGAANHRLIVHLPLIVPPDCGIRVGDHAHVWREGKLFAFDDSFEHEAWNRSSAERVNLIFEAHRPDVNSQERRAIEHTLEVRGSWLRSRRVPEA